MTTRPGPIRQVPFYTDRIDPKDWNYLHYAREINVLRVQNPGVVFKTYSRAEFARLKARRAWGMSTPASVDDRTLIARLEALRKNRR